MMISPRHTRDGISRSLLPIRRPSLLSAFPLASSDSSSLPLIDAAHLRSYSPNQFDKPLSHARNKEEIRAQQRRAILQTLQPEEVERADFVLMLADSIYEQKREQETEQKDRLSREQAHAWQEKLKSGKRR